MIRAIYLAKDTDFYKNLFRFFSDDNNHKTEKATQIKQLPCFI